MNCQDISQNIYEYCEDSLSSELHKIISQHLNECESCRNIYNITMIENEVLKDTQDIPALSPVFTSMVMNQLEKVDMRRNLWFSFNQSTWYLGLAMLAAVIALCLYLPHFKENNNSNINLAENTITSQQSDIYDDGVYGKVKPEQIITPNTTPDITANNSRKSIVMNDSYTITQTPVVPNTTPNINASNSGKFIVMDDSYNIAQTPVVPDISPNQLDSVTLENTNRADIPEETRTHAMDQSTTILATPTYSPQNVPDKFKLLKQTTGVNQEIIYSYISQDGKENFTLTIVPYTDKTTSLTSLNNSPQSNPPSQFRIFEIGDKKITVDYSGNLSDQEMTKLINTIKF